VPQLAKYEVLEEIGHGGMATVYRARDRRLGRDVALKVIHPHLRDSREVVMRFNTEAKAVAKLRHRNIVEVFDVSAPDEKEQYLVCEFVRGTTLRKLIERHGALAPEIAAAIAIELLGALAHANQTGVVHRDIKPENVLVEHRPAVADSGEGGPVSAGARVAIKLTDFGIAKLLDAQGVTSTGQVLGSPAHMAPEQIEGGEVDGRADVFGLGVLLYECMVGHLPFTGKNPAQVLRRVLDGTYPEAQSERPLVGSRWSAILDRALAHAAADRFPDAGAMKVAIEAELARLGVERPQGELEAWLDEPEAYTASHKDRMIARLCELAAEERKRRDVLAAASDYNRALAHAPEDPQLLRIVAGMNRAEARTRHIRRGAIGLAAASALAIAAFGLARMRQSPRLVTALPESQDNPSALDTPAFPSASQDTLPRASAVPSESIPAVTGPTARRVVPLALGAREPAQPRAVERQLTLDMKPPMGVSVSVDDEPAREVSTGDRLTLDGKPHALVFSCPRRGGDDPCVAVRLTVPAGDGDDRLVVSVPVKPATLVVEGDVAKTYQIVQHPEISIRAGKNTISLKSAYEPVTVREIETGDSVSVRLEAGQTVPAAFPAK
jgi:serine/threonine-protein kinase